MREVRGAVIAVVLVAPLVAFGVIDRASRRDEPAPGGLNAPSARVAGAQTSDDNPYWSGYVVTGPSDKYVSYRSVTGTWKVPTVTCTPADAGAASAIWVGLGGYNVGSRVLEQVGVNANCDATGKPFYFAWHELVPDIARNIAAKVLPGDTITGSVRILGHGLVELRVENHTRRWTFRQRITWGNADTSSAEWIMEAPQTCRRNSCHEARLANFGSVEMGGIRATDTSLAGTLVNAAWTATAIRLVPDAAVAPGRRDGARAVAGASAGSPTSDGERFEISWMPDAAKG